MPTPAPASITYTLPARHLAEGMSTDDGCDILDVHTEDGHVHYHVYEPSGDDDTDNERQCSPEGRCDPLDARVELAVYPDTAVDASAHPDAVITNPTT